MTDDLVQLLEGLFADIGVRARPGVSWMASARSLPLEVEVGVANLSSRSFLLPGPGVAESVVRFAGELQRWLASVVGATLPPCPSDGQALVPRLLDGSAVWECPSGDFGCGFGRYELSLWPPSADDDGYGSARTIESADRTSRS